MPGAALLRARRALGGQDVRVQRPTPSCTSWSTRSSATTIRCRIACSCTTSGSSASTCSGRCAASRGPPGTFGLYAVEGGTAAMCYIFKSLKANRLLNPGDTIAMVTPIFTPYLEMPHLEDYGLQDRQHPGAAGAALAVHRSGSGAAARSHGQGVLRRQSRQPVRGRPQPRVDRGDRHGSCKARPDLMLLTDDVYGTFVPGIPIAARRVSQEHHRRLLLQQVLRLFGLAPGRHRPAREQHLRREDRRAARSGRSRRSTSATRR